MAAEHERDPTGTPAAEPAVGPPVAAPGPASAPGASMAAMLYGPDGASRARAALQLQRTHGNAFVTRLARGVAAPMLQRTELTPTNLALPQDIAQEYSVSPELEEMLARVSRGELSAEQAAAEMAGTGEGAGATAAEAATQGGVRVAARALVQIASSGPAMVGLFGAFVTIASMLATLEQGDEERRVGDQIVAATDGYVAGFMSGVGWSMSGGDAAWFADARAKGAAAKAALVAKVKASPALKNFDIGPDEVMLAIMDRREAFHKELYAHVKPQIASLYIKKWHDSLGWMTTTFTNEAETGERNIRTRAGLKDTGPLPEPKLGEPQSAPAAP